MAGVATPDVISGEHHWKWFWSPLTLYRVRCGDGGIRTHGVPGGSRINSPMVSATHPRHQHLPYATATIIGGRSCLRSRTTEYHPAHSAHRSIPAYSEWFDQ